MRRAVSRTGLLTVGGLLVVVLAAVALRLVPIVLVPSLNWGDEVFQTIEPAHRLVYGYGLVTWEFQLGMRSWLLPGAIAGLIEIARLFGDGPAYYLPAIAVGLGLLAAAPALCAFLWCRREFGLAAAFVAAAGVAIAPELVYFGARALNEVVAAHLLIIALYLALPGHPVADRRRLVAAGALLALVSLLRLQLAPAAALIALWPAGGDWRRRLATLVGGGLAALAVGALFDWATLGFPLASVWRNLYYNLYLGVASGFSVEPWYYYLIGELGIWGLAAPLAIVPLWLGARRMPVLLAAAALIVAVHIAIPHKEYRFIYPAVVLLMVLAGIGLAQLTASAAAWLARRGMRPKTACAVAMVAFAGGWSGLAVGVWSDGTLALLRQRAHDELVAMSFVRRLPTPCGLGLYGRNAWVRYGGYSHLHRPLAMYWPDDAAALTDAAPAFDTLVYDRRKLTPPPALGFRPLRCFGDICVARRAGGCMARPMAAMWFPPALRGLRPDRRRFPAVPRAVAVPPSGR